jgi:hypothetical protein
MCAFSYAFRAHKIALAANANPKLTTTVHSAKFTAPLKSEPS